jgi:hypothetical protein
MSLALYHSRVRSSDLLGIDPSNVGSPIKARTFFHSKDPELWVGDDYAIKHDVIWIAVFVTIVHEEREPTANCLVQSETELLQPLDRSMSA